ncbi:MAG: caspase family protein, partial [Actinomycetota bacterium]|nr:caspase family protein [Actinomycetota bacterium]
ALLAGINDHAGRTRDNVGSYQDAVLLRQILLANGWRDDHILLLGERQATRDRVVRGLEWLSRKTDARSVAVFSYSGHTRQASAADGDAETLDEGLWGADNAYLWDGDLGRMLGAVAAGRMWISIQACEAAGFNDAGTERPGRVLTYSSYEHEKSYEDPEFGHSVQGRFLLMEGLAQGWGDADGDGTVSVQEAQRWATPRADIRASGRQTMVLVDGVGSPFTLRVR